MSVTPSACLRGSLPRGIGLAMLIFSVTACGSARHGEPIAGPMPLVNASLQRGKTLYDMQCYLCHSAGEGGMAPALNNKPLPRSLIQFQIRHGLGVMPSFSERQLSDRDLEDIANYLVALRHHGGEK